jgi:hypothetical protein
MDTTEFEFEAKEGPSLGCPDMGSTEGSGNREPRCTGAPKGATGQDPVSVSLAEKVSTLGFQKTKKTRCGAAKRRARRAKRVEPPGGEPAGGDTQLSLGGQPHQGGTSPFRKGRVWIGGWTRFGGTRSFNHRGRGQPTGPGKRQMSSGGIPGDRQAKRPRQTGQPSYAKVAQEDLREAMVWRLPGDSDPQGKVQGHTEGCWPACGWASRRGVHSTAAQHLLVQGGSDHGVPGSGNPWLVCQVGTYPDGLGGFQV